jgi:hypothetical protein
VPRTLRLFFVTLGGILILGCKTGSNYEKLKQPRTAVAETPAPAGLAARTFLVRPFTFAEVGDRTEMFRRAFLVLGYKGIDFDTYGRMDPADQKTGMKTIYSLPEVHKLIAAQLTRLEIPTVVDADVPPDKGGVLDVRVLGSESSLRIHTYGCWPIVGTVVYLFNADIYTVVTKTRFEYRVSGIPVKEPSAILEVYSEKDFSFWETYLGFEISESFEEAQTEHVKDIAGRLARLLRADAL